MHLVVAGLRIAVGGLLIATGAFFQYRSFRRRLRIARVELPGEPRLYAWKNIEEGWDFWAGLGFVVVGVLLLP